MKKIVLVAAAAGLMTLAACGEKKTEVTNTTVENTVVENDASIIENGVVTDTNTTVETTSNTVVENTGNAM